MKLLSILSLKKNKTPPIWLMRQAGRYMASYRAIREKIPSFLDLCFNPSLVSEVTCQPINQFHFDAGILFSDILVIPKALGQSVSFVSGDGPVLGPLNRQELLDVCEHAFLSTLDPVFEGIKLIKKTPTFQTIPLIGFAGAPWTVSTYMVEGKKSSGHQHVKHIVFSDPQAQDDLIEKITEATLIYLKKQIDSGVDVIQIFDTWASALPTRYFERWCLRPLLKMAQSIKEYSPNMKIIYFPKGCAGLYPLLADALNGIIDGIAIDHNVDHVLVKKLFGEKLAIQGGLDPVLLLQGGAICWEEARQLMKNYEDVPYIFNLSHGILPTTPEKNVVDLVRCVRENL